MIVEMGRLAEEVGLVGGDAVDQVDGLGLQPVLVEQVAAVVVERGDAGRAQRGGAGGLPAWCAWSAAS